MHIDCQQVCSEYLDIWIFIDQEIHLSNYTLNLRAKDIFGHSFLDFKKITLLVFKYIKIDIYL